MKLPRLPQLLLCGTFAILVSPLHAVEKASPELKASKVTQAPVIDGVIDETWKTLPELNMTAKLKEDSTELSLKACHDGTTFFLLATWPDPDASIHHNPWVWDEEKKAYKKGTQKEDRFAFEIPMSDTFQACMLGGTPYISDVWHWKAARTNPSGRVDEEWHQISLKPFKVGETEADQFDNCGPDRKTTLFMLRVKDEGKMACTSQDAPKEKGEALVPQYLKQETDGGQAEVTAKGVWAEGKWTVEFSRSLAINNKKEDVALEAGTSYPFAIAVFDKVSDANHHTTKKGTLVLEK